MNSTPMLLQLSSFATLSRTRCAGAAADATLMWRRILTLALVAAAAAVATSTGMGPGTARAGVFEQIGKEVNEIFERASPSIIKVRSEGALTLAGSGFFIDDKGTILTADAILGANSIVTVDYKGARMRAEVLGRDRRSGMAMLRIEAAGTPALSFAKSPNIGPGIAVVIIGYPLNMSVAPCFGFMSGADYQYMGRTFATSHLRAAVPILPGQVGGPMLDTHGEVIGMVITAIGDGKGVYVLPSAAMTKIVSDFQHFKEARHAWVGVGVMEKKGGDGRPRIAISHLYDNTPALTSGLKPGDEVLRINARTILSAGDVLDASFYCQVGQPITVTVLREGKEITVEFTAEARPTSMPAVALGIAPQPQSAPLPPGPASTNGAAGIETTPEGTTLPAPGTSPGASPGASSATVPPGTPGAGSAPIPQATLGEGGTIPISSTTNAAETK
ncbi:MAG TPA: trypsin-like peptidase domain-containing protein [Candidatus Methylacidiphilales bacterium]|nr:trypsin-like peptidase domain-containing protein [Candidatus Methylacidiphilales bacterium]